jgi:hypothetical protein
MRRMTAEINFVRQQGWRHVSPDTCGVQFPALMWQPRVIGLLFALGLLLQAWPYFLALSALLWWSAALPRLNPFDAVYNAVVSRSQGSSRLAPAPGPRRFAQAMAGTFMLAIALSLLFAWRPLAWTLEAVLAVALAALIFGRFCLGSYVFLVLTGQRAFANRTLPWVRLDSSAETTL